MMNDTNKFPFTMCLIIYLILSPEGRRLQVRELEKIIGNKREQKVVWHHVFPFSPKVTDGEDLEYRTSHSYHATLLRD